MKIHCTKCGEELLGAVNRCWKCGTHFMPHSDTSAPPVRTNQAPSDLPMADSPEPNDRPSGENSTKAVSSTPALGNREKGAVSSLIVSVIGIASLMFPPLAIILGLLGMLLGIYGIESKRCLLATIGLVLSVLVIAAGILQLMLRIYAWRYGGSPFTPQVQPVFVE